MKPLYQLIVAAILIASQCFDTALAQPRGPVLNGEAARSVQAWVTRPERTAEQRAQDAYRKPAQTLDFFGLEPDWKVIEFIPGAGYYSEILASGLDDDGELLVIGFGANNGVRAAEAAGANVSAIPESAWSTTPPAPATRWSTLEKFDLGIDDADMFITVRNLHNFTQESRPLLHDGVYDALKSGGIYAIIDHTRRHNDPGGIEIWRRVDPVQVIKEVEAAGFEFVDYSNMHFRPDDELDFDTTRPSLNRYSDRFTMKFRKP